MNQRFQRAALIAEAARLESYIQQQLTFTFAQLRDAQAAGYDIQVRRLQPRFDQLDICRAHCNELRTLLWNLE